MYVGVLNAYDIGTLSYHARIMIIEIWMAMVTASALYTALKRAVQSDGCKSAKTLRAVFKES
jgi:hypothetical protein